MCHPERPGKASSLAKLIEKESHRFWARTNVPPLTLSAIEALLQTAVSKGKIRGRD